jgi:hypothetical protein
MEQFTNFYVNTALPEYEKIIPDVKLYLVHGKRGGTKIALD